MPDSVQGALWRLRCAEGHLRAIGDKIAAGEPCEGILMQLTAVRGSIDAIARQLFLEQVERSKSMLYDNPELEMQFKEFERLIELCDLWRQSKFDIARTEVNQ